MVNSDDWSVVAVAVSDPAVLARFINYSLSLSIINVLGCVQIKKIDE
jgi:hypothetical protein